jgi:Ser/Thr protein kinase RdoA (MazF antagonist)
MATQAAEQHQLDRLAREAIGRWGFGPESTVELINVSENSTYRAEEPGSGRRAAVRVHRLGYHDPDEVESELAWIDALRADGIATPLPLRALDGRRVVPVASDELREAREVVAFDWVDGEPPGAGDVDSFRRLGAISARLHLQSRAWPVPPGFRRFVWDYDRSLGGRCRWGRWQDGLGIGREELALLGRLDDTVRRRLQAYGADSERFGLVHADLRLANLLVVGGEPVVIDFDDCGFSWFMYDWGTAVSFIEHEPHVPELQAAWVEGYRSVAPLRAEDEAELPTFVMLRRLLLVAWIGSHHTFAPEAAELGAEYTAGTCELAERYLSATT